MKRVTGIGGVFFRSPDPGAALDWYRAHLGIDSEAWGGHAFQWIDKDRPENVGYTVLSVFAQNADYLEPTTVPYMINFRVDDLERLVAALRDEGVDILGDIEEHPNGKFAWIRDLEGRKVELWEPVPSADDPYV